MPVSYKLFSQQDNPIHIKSPNSQALVTPDRVPNIRCPHCMHMGAFTSLGQHDIQIAHFVAQDSKPPLSRGASWVGIRVCPNQNCRGIVLAVIDHIGVVTLPTEVLDFNPLNIPPPIANSLEEAVQCHSAHCYKAAAMMVRRVLEELCEDKKATGNNLKERIAALSKLIVVPQKLMEAADHLRMLGNDAAHIEARSYQTVGEREVRLAIDLTKELLKAAYQYDALLTELLGLKMPEQ
jgi:hypothetical protein